MGRTEGEESDFGILRVLDDWCWNITARCGELFCQTIHILFVIVRPLAIDGALVVPTAAGKVSGTGVRGTGQGAITDTIAVDVRVALKAPQLFQVFRGQHLS